MERARVTISELLQHDSHKRSELVRIVRSGSSIHQAAKEVGVSLELLYKLLKTDPLFRNDWEEARKDAADTIADGLLNVLDSAETVADAMIGKARSENIKTIAGWRNPSRYGSRLNIDVTHTVDLSKALQQAEQRTIPILEQAALERVNALNSNALQELPPVDKVAPAPSHSVPIKATKTVDKYGRSVDKSEKYAERDKLKDMARRRAEQDYQVVDVEVEQVAEVSTDDMDRFL